jgi:RNA polymerase sigma-70 factor (ECF subfamily)
VSLALLPDPQDEDDFIGRCRAGDVAGWRALYDRYLPLVFRVAQRLGVDERDIRDVCQEVFLRVYRGLGSFRGGAQFSTWLYRIALNEAARAGRATTVRRAVMTLLGREATPSPAPRPDTELGRNEAARELERMLAGMRPRQREVFVLFEIEELPLVKIAEILGCGLETVRSRLRHARADFDRLCRQRQLTSAPTGRDDGAPTPRTK